MRDTIHSMVDKIEPLDAVEAEHRDDVLSWVGSGAELFRVSKPATPPKHLVAYSVLVDTACRRMLLVDHRDARLWLPTGGHVDPNEHPAHAARREIAEELGIWPEFHPAIGDKPLMVTVVQTTGVSEPHTDVSLWFVFRGSERDTLRSDEREFSAAQWWTFDDIEHRPGTRFDPNLPRFVRKLRSAKADEADLRPGFNSLR